MLKILVKKQLGDIFRSYTYDAKKNRARSKGATIGFIVLFVVLMVGVLGGLDGVHHHRQVAAGGIFHAHGNVQAAGDEAVLLVLHRAGADGRVGKDVREVIVILRVQQLICAGKARLLQHLHVHFADGDEAVEQVRLAVGIRLVKHALVAVAGGTGLVGVDSRNQDQAVRYLVVDFCKTVDIIADRILVICRAGTDND